MKELEMTSLMKARSYKSIQIPIICTYFIYESRCFNVATDENADAAQTRIENAWYIPQQGFPRV